MINKSIYQEKTTILNVHASKRVSEHTKQNFLELKGEIIDQLDQLEYYSQQQ